MLIKKLNKLVFKGVRKNSKKVTEKRKYLYVKRVFDKKLVFIFCCNSKTNSGKYLNVYKMLILVISSMVKLSKHFDFV